MTRCPFAVHSFITMLRLRWHAESLAICRLRAEAPLPHWFASAERSGPFVAMVRTSDELSLVVRADAVPDTQDPEIMAIEREFVACTVVGPLDFGLVGVLRRLTGPLADAGIPVLAISTFDTDWLLVRRDAAVRAAGALSLVALLDNEPPR